MWSANDISLTFLDDLTDDPIVAANISTPDGTLTAMARIDVDGTTLNLCELHLHGRDVGPRQYGHRRLFNLIWAVMQQLEKYDVIAIQGAVRTTGAGKGHRPRLLRFTREALHRHFFPEP